MRQLKWRYSWILIKNVIKTWSKVEELKISPVWENGMQSGIATYCCGLFCRPVMRGLNAVEGNCGNLWIWMKSFNSLTAYQRVWPGERWVGLSLATSCGQTQHYITWRTALCCPLLGCKRTCGTTRWHIRLSSFLSSWRRERSHIYQYVFQYWATL